jgi:hypothetical protein
MLAPLLGALALCVAGATLAPATAAAASPGAPRAVIAVLPYGTTVEQIAAAGDLAPGIVSAGLGAVPVAQTFLDSSQGNRLNEALYDQPLPRLYVEDGRVPPGRWARVIDRAESAPARIEPGLLASVLEDAGVPVTVEAESGLASLIGVDRSGVARIAPNPACTRGCAPGLTVLRIRLGELAPLAERLPPGQILIAFASGSGSQQELLPAGVQGLGGGDLTSSSTRTDGVVLTTDIAPTVLEHFGLEVPDAVTGSAIEVSGERDPDAVADLRSRLDHRPSRDAVVLLPLAAWLLASGCAALAWRRRGARVALRLLALACAWAPLLLLALAAPDAGPLASALVVGLGAPLLALATDRALSPYAGVALASGVTVAAYAVDVIAGSPLTSLSVLGPNPGAGVRFFGIGNELEAILTTLTLIGAGAWVETRRPLAERRAALWFVAIGLAAAVAFAPGRFGADVGAAIVLGAGTATAVVLVLGLERRRAIAIVVGGGALALVALFAIDLVLGGAHLSRSVLGAGEASDLVDVLDRRLTLMVHTFTHPVYPELLVACALLLLAGFARRRSVLAWFEPRWAARSGFLGAVVGVLVGTVANDSGSVLLVIGTIYLAVFAGFFWGSRKEGATGSPVGTIDGCA